MTNLVYQQASLLKDPLTPLAKPEFHFGYEFTSGCHQHWRTIQDWEVQAAYLAYQRRYHTKEKALDSCSPKNLLPSISDTLPGTCQTRRGVYPNPRLRG